MTKDKKTLEKEYWKKAVEIRENEEYRLKREGYSEDGIKEYYEDNYIRCPHCDQLGPIDESHRGGLDRWHSFSKDDKGSDDSMVCRICDKRFYFDVEKYDVMADLTR